MSEQPDYAIEAGNADTVDGYHAQEIIDTAVAEAETARENTETAREEPEEWRIQSERFRRFYDDTVTMHPRAQILDVSVNESETVLTIWWREPVTEDD